MDNGRADRLHGLSGDGPHMPKTLVEEIELANSSFLGGRQSSMSSEGPPFVVVCCIDPRLTGFIEPALGLPRNRAVTVRVAGNRVSRENPDVLRSLAAAVYLKGATEILVVGHTDCAMANFQTTQVADAFRKADVPRSAFGDQDLRTWFGAIGNTRGNVAESIDFIRRCGILPAGIAVHGFIIDTKTGKLDRIASAQAEAASARVETPEPPAAPPPVPAQPPPSPVPSNPPQRPVIIEETRRPAARSPQAPHSLLEAGRMFATVIQRARSNPRFQEDVLELRSVLQRERNPLKVLSAVEALAGRHSAEYPELPPLAVFLRGILSDRASARGDAVEVIRRLLG